MRRLLHQRAWRGMHRHVVLSSRPAGVIGEISAICCTISDETAGKRSPSAACTHFLLAMSGKSAVVGTVVIVAVVGVVVEPVVVGGVILTWILGSWQKQFLLGSLIPEVLLPLLSSALTPFVSVRSRRIP